MSLLRLLILRRMKPQITVLMVNHRLPTQICISVILLLQHLLVVIIIMLPLLLIIIFQNILLLPILPILLSQPAPDLVIQHCRHHMRCQQRWQLEAIININNHIIFHHRRLYRLHNTQYHMHYHLVITTCPTQLTFPLSTPALRPLLPPLLSQLNNINHPPPLTFLLPCAPPNLPSRLPFPLLLLPREHRLPKEIFLPTKIVVGCQYHQWIMT